MNDRQPASAQQPQFQPNILSRCPAAYCGRMLGYAIKQPEAARRWLDELQRLSYCERPEGGFFVTIAFSNAGLERLASPVDLSAFPDPFRVGMAGRAARLGDPPWPQLEGEPEQHAAILAEAEARRNTHVLVLVLGQLDGERDAELFTLLHERGAAAQCQSAVDVYGDRLERLLESKFQAFEEPAPRGAARVWSQYLHQPLIKDATLPGGHGIVEYFGFRDGIGQPKRDNGEVDRDTVLVKSDNRLLDQGSFLVVRQLQQDPGAFWKAMRATAPGAGGARELAERLLGRRQDGRALDGTPPKLDAEGESSQAAFERARDEVTPTCPFQAHVRRVNPQLDSRRAGVTARLLRRAMSYREASGKVGMMFMAYNADLEAQYEFIQSNWIARGNHTGGLSCHRDPIAALSANGGEPAATSFVAANADGSSLALRLPSFVKLRWGGYFFVPCRQALQLLLGEQAEPQARAGESGGLAQPALTQHAIDASDSERLAEALRCINDPRAAATFWRELPGGGSSIAGHHFVKAEDDILKVLDERRPSTGFSVCEYGRRGASMLGPIMLTIDSDRIEYALAAHARKLIPYDHDELEPLMQHARKEAARFLKAASGRAQLRGLLKPGTRASFKSDQLMAFVLAEVWMKWAQVPGPSSGSLTLWGRQISEAFARLSPPTKRDAEPGRPAPEDDEIKLAQGRQAGRELTHYIRRWLADVREQAAPHQPSSRLLRYFEDAAVGDDEAVRAISGLVAGSSVTTVGTFAQGLASFARGKTADALTADIKRAGEAAGENARWPRYDDVVAGGLAQARLGTPDYLYRTYMGTAPLRLPGGLQVQRGERVIAWLGGAAGTRPELRFGAGPHACPGREMAKAMIEGTLAALQGVAKLERVDDVGLEFAFDYV